MRAEDADDTLFRIVKGAHPIIFFMYPLSEPSIIQPTNHPYHLRSRNPPPISPLSTMNAILLTECCLTRSSADADNRLDAFSGQSRSTNMVPFHM